jgi:hypothetical protein
MAIMVLRTCQQVEGGLPADVTSKMYFNIILDFGIGLVPFLGDIADAVFRANTRNAVVLEKFLRAKGASALKAQGQVVPAIDPSDPDEYDRQMNEQHGPPPKYTDGPAPVQGSSQQAGQVPLAQPAQARVPEERRGGVESGNTRRMDEPLSTVSDAHPARTRSTLQKNRPGY